MSRNRIIFFGSPDFALPSLAALERAGLQPDAVVTQPDRPAGRGRRPTPPPVKRWAEARGIAVLQPERVRRKAFREQYDALDPELAIVVAFGQIMPRSVIERPRLGTINIHGSLLPEYRGPAPIQWAVLDGKKRTGVTVQQVVYELDAGDVLLQAATDIGPDETAGELFERLAVLGAGLLPEAVVGLRDGALTPRPQDPARVTYARMLEKRDGRIDWTRDAQGVHDHIRGMSPWPGAFSGWQGKRLAIHRARRIDEDHPDAAPGTVLAIQDDGVRVACGEGVVSLCELQLAGRKRLQCREFVSGCRVAVGDRLELAAAGCASTSTSTSSPRSS